MWLTRCLGFVAVCCALGAEPVAAQEVAVVNAASYADQALPSGGIAQGSLFTVFGSGMGPDELTHAVPWPFPMQLAGTTVAVEVGGVTVNCFLVYTSASQVAAILPSDVPMGDGLVTVSYNGTVAATGPIRVVGHSFGIFTINQQGEGQTVATDPMAEGEVYSIVNSAMPGDLIDIWGTGLGAVEFGDEGEPEPGDLDYDVKVLVAGVEVPVVYAGRSGCCSGVDIVRFVAPEITGCFVPLTVFVDGVPGNYGSISIDPSGEACEYDPLFGGVDLTLLSEEEIATGAITLAKARTFEPKPDGVFGGGSPVFETHRLQESISAVYQTAAMSSPKTLGDVRAVSKLGACTVRLRRLNGVLVKPRLDVGSTMTLVSDSGPKGLEKQGDSSFRTNISDFQVTPMINFGGPNQYYRSGLHTVTVSGGADVGPHEASIMNPTEIGWGNREEIGTVVERDQPLTVQYTAVGFDFVEISGSAPIGDGEVVFTCAADASAASFTVPVEVLAALPDSPPDSSDERLGTGSLTVTGHKSASYEAPGTDINTIRFVNSQSQLDVDFN